MLTFVVVTAAPRRSGVFAICKLAVTPSFSLRCSKCYERFPVSRALDHFLQIPANAHSACASVCYGPPACFGRSLSCASISPPNLASFNSAPTTCLFVSRLSTSFGDRFRCPVLQVTKLRFREMKSNPSIVTKFVGGKAGV